MFSVVSPSGFLNYHTSSMVQLDKINKVHKKKEITFKAITATLVEWRMQNNQDLELKIIILFILPLCFNTQAFISAKRCVGKQISKTAYPKCHQIFDMTLK